MHTLEHDEDDSFHDDGAYDGVCPRCHDDGRDPMTDYLTPCPLCQAEQCA